MNVPRQGMHPNTFPLQKATLLFSDNIIYCVDIDKKKLFDRFFQHGYEFFNTFKYFITSLKVPCDTIHIHVNNYIMRCNLGFINHLL
jgi:hypothetical protein